MRLQSLFLVALFPFASTVFAQSPRQYYHTSGAWTDLNLNGKISGKFSWQLENQQRRVDMQGDYNESTTTGNPYHNFNQHLFRPYIHYQLNPTVRFSLMPLGWIGSNRFKDGVPSAFFAEYRISPQVILTQQIGKLRIDHRFRYEFRWIGANQSVDNKSFIYGGDFSTATFREKIRYHLKLSMPFGKEKMEDKTWYGIAFNEFMANMGENSPNINLMDQNRIYVGIGYRFTKNYSLETGYLQQTAFRFNNTLKNNVDINNTLYLNFIVSNVETLFKK